ncbi:MAG TPA: DNA repair protein RadA [Candidatus Kapabacteria bacterium]|nr:DNA repair protein RadA [Candidatus Kapabacteria bacterium]
MKKRIIYECSSCGEKSPKWAGKCSNCGNWNTLVETIDESSKQTNISSKVSGKIYKLSELDTSPDFRISTNIKELDRVLGGGIIPGSLVLVGGDPGIGKSTIMLQMCSSIQDFDTIYITGEESLKQIKYRTSRIKNISELSISAETDIDIIVNTIKNSGATVAIVDSIQSVYSSEIDSTAGSITQIRESAMKLFNLAKKEGIAIFLIGHVTKDGFIAGPKILEHTVDTVLQFEGEKNYSFRILRALKNRFGSTNEIGIFEMSDSGLNEVQNPSEIFLSGFNKEESGISVVSAIEGTRPILLEAQALVGATGYGTPQRVSNGYDGRRLQMLLAVIEKRLGFQLKQQDVFINVAGGLYINDTSIDLGIAVAIISSFADKSIPHNTLLIGEIGLTGEVRSVSNIEQRITEAEKLGFEKCIIPKINFDKIAKGFAINLIGIDKISSALSQLL